MIPKTIHYCWFGGPESELVQHCVRSWRTHLPDYRIVRWDESNFDIDSNPHASSWYRSKLYAFVADYARAFVLHREGGIYLDSDVEVFPGRNFDGLLANEAFVGFQYPWPDIHGPDTLENNRIGNCVMGSAPASRFFSDLLRQFDKPLGDPRLDARNPSFVLPVDYTREVLMSYGLSNYGRQTVNGVLVLPKEFFLTGISHRPQLREAMTSDSICMHYGALSWEPALLDLRKSSWRRALSTVARGTRTALRRLVRQLD